MAIRKQSRRTLGTAQRKRRTILPLVEGLEQRLVLSISNTPLVPHNSLVPVPLASGGTGWMLAPSSSSSGGTTQPVQPTPSHPGPIMGHLPVASPFGSNPAQQTAGPAGSAGYAPQQIQTAYGLSTGSVLTTGSAYNNNILFGTIKGDGAGQTIGIFEECVQPRLRPHLRYPNYSTSALATFDKTFGLPDPPSLNFFDQTGRPLSASNNPSNNRDFNHADAARRPGLEIALDIEWAHAMAPGASIDVALHRPGSPSDLDIPTGMATARRPPRCLGGLGQLWLSASTLWRDDPGATVGRTYPVKPALAAHPNVSFFAGSGDYGTFGLIYPSASPDVVSVGGTSLSLTKSGQWSDEVGWAGSGGGIQHSSPDTHLPAERRLQRQRRLPHQSRRCCRRRPDTGVAVYDPFDFGTATPWVQAAAPAWRPRCGPAWPRIADQGRVLAGGTAPGLPTAILTDLYDSGQVAPADFHDITQGDNGFSAGPGYDLVTGLGSPKANLLIPAPVAFGLASKATIATQPPPSVVAGHSFGIIALRRRFLRVIDPAYNNIAILSLVGGPSGAVVHAGQSAPVTPMGWRSSRTCC